MKKDSLDIGRTMPADKQVTSGYRPIQNGAGYNKYFPTPEKQDRIIIEDGEVSQTVELMKKVVWKYLSDTKQIAPVLSGKNLEKTCISIWEFLYNHIQYKLDQKGLEQLRTPARSWQDRKTGIDCDCFSIFASSILTNLKIPHSFRITKYDRDVYQHVYVIVPHKNGTYIIDPVLSKANYEQPFKQKKDFPMSIDGIDIAVLSGTVDEELHSVVMASDLEGLALGSTDSKEELNALYRHLISTRNAVANNPESIALIDDPEAFLKMLDYAIEHWNTPQRDHALEILEQNEDKLNLQQGVSGLDDEEDDEDLLGRLFKRRKNKGSRKGFFKNIRKAAKNVGKGLKKVGKAIVRFNPVSIAARNGFLLALKLNVKGMASKLKWAYAGKEQAQRKGISTEKWNQSQEALKKVESLFADKLQGRRSALKKAILNGKAGGLSGELGSIGELKGLGEPVSAASAATLMATASPIIISVVKILKKAGLMDPSEKESVDVSDTDIQNMVSDPSAIDTYSDQDNLLPDNYPNKMKSRNADGSKPEGGNKLVRFLKNNPMVAVGSAALVAGASYLLFSGSSKPKAALSGTKSNTWTTAKKKPTTRKKTIKTKTPRVKTIQLS